jgi:hypothetical protein
MGMKAVGTRLTYTQDNVEESLMNAFAGLGVFLEDEKAQGTAPTLPNLHAAVATKAADDVF